MNIERGMNSLLPYIEKIKKNRPGSGAVLDDSDAVYCRLSDAVCLLRGSMADLSAGFSGQCDLRRRPLLPDPRAASQTAAGSFLIHTACALLGAINYFVSVFRGTPVLPWDPTALNTAIAVSSTYDFTPNGPMIITAVLLADFCLPFCAFASLTFCPARSPRAFRCRYG